MGCLNLSIAIASREGNPIYIRGVAVGGIGPARDSKPTCALLCTCRRSSDFLTLRGEGLELQVNRPSE